MERIGRGEYALHKVGGRGGSDGRWAAILRSVRQRRALVVTGAFVLIAATVASVQKAAAVPPPGNVAPSIESFEAVNVLDDVWEFRGSIVDEEPDGCVINFGELLDGHSVDVNADGSFSYTLQLGPEEEGVVTAQAVDPEGLESDVAQDAVVQ